ncbi:MAG: hypothetical protein PVJ93_07965, partial [Pseudomonadales bacterium]
MAPKHRLRRLLVIDWLDPALGEIQPPQRVFPQLPRPLGPTGRRHRDDFNILVIKGGEIPKPFALNVPHELF